MSRAALREALSEAAVWRLAGLLLERPRPGWRAEVERLRVEVSDPALSRAATEAGRADEGGYLAMLGPGGRVSPREVAYRRFGDPGRILADLAAFYDAFSYRPAAEDPPDHVALEAGFVGYLRLKEAFAIERCDVPAADVTAAARTAFVQEHLRPMLGPMARRLAASGDSYLVRVSRALVERVGDAPDPPEALGACDPAEGVPGCPGVPGRA